MSWIEISAILSSPAPQLAVLDLSNTEVSPEGITRLSSLHQLTTLGLTGVKGLGDLDCLTALPQQLTGIYIDATTIDDDAIESLLRFRKLETLHVGHTNISPTGLIELVSGLPELVDLAVDGLKVQEAIGSIAAIPRLHNLNLKNTDLTDDGLLRLSDIDSLEFLDVANTTITASAVERYRRIRPDCLVLTEEESEF